MKQNIIHEIIDEYKRGVLRTGISNRRDELKKENILIKKSQIPFEFLEISSEIIIVNEEELKNNDIFELTKQSCCEKNIETKINKFFTKNPYIDIKSFRIQEFILFFENLYREESIIGQKNFGSIIKAVSNAIPEVFKIIYSSNFIFLLFFKILDFSDCKRDRRSSIAENVYSRKKNL